MSPTRPTTDAPVSAIYADPQTKSPTTDIAGTNNTAANTDNDSVNTSTSPVMWALAGVGILVLVVAIARSPQGKRLRTRMLTRKTSEDAIPQPGDPIVHQVDERTGDVSFIQTSSIAEEAGKEFKILNEHAFVRATDLRTQQTYYIKKNELEELYKTRKHKDFLIEEDL